MLLRGNPGSGKSSLTLRMIDAPGLGLGDTMLRAMLVADDQTQLTVGDGCLLATPPEALAGLLEVRGLGILRLPHVPQVAVALVADLRPANEVPRLPEPQELQTEILGFRLPRLILDGHGTAASAILRAALSGFGNLLP